MTSDLLVPPPGLLPEPADGVRWAEVQSSDRGFRLTFESTEGNAGGHAELLFDERAPGEWRVSLSFTETEAQSWSFERALLGWMERMAEHVLKQRLRDGANVSLCRDYALEVSEEAVAGLRAAGFELAVAEDEMRRPTAGTPDRNFPPGYVVLPWEEQAAPLFHHAYFEAFRDRPGFPGWDEARWRAAFASGEEFRPGLSMVVLDGPEPAAFAVVWVEEGAGWVTQMGVRPEWRGKGLGEALLAHALAAFAEAGIETAALEVATNNPRARALYERMGFTVAGGYRSWRKVIS